LPTRRPAPTTYVTAVGGFPIVLCGDTLEWCGGEVSVSRLRSEILRGLGASAVLTHTNRGDRSLLDRYPAIASIIETRDAVPMMDGALAGRTIAQVAARLDGLLHKQARPDWVRKDEHATSFVDYYVPMLERDRQMVDHNFELMRSNRWRPTTAPNARYSPRTDGLELTQWMIADFYHLLDTDPVVDWGLARFNQQRRADICLPAGWNEPG